jgi:hypothetical protein
LGENFYENPVGIRLIGHVGLVRLDLHEGLATLHLATHVDEPLEHGSLLHRVGEAGHHYVSCHL